jgi:hypothetical protein
MADFPVHALLGAWQEAVAQLTTVQQQLEYLLSLTGAAWPRPVAVEASLRLMQTHARHAHAALQRVPTPCLVVVADVWATLEEPHVETETPNTNEEAL